MNQNPLTESNLPLNQICNENKISNDIVGKDVFFNSIKSKTLEEALSQESKAAKKQSSEIKKPLPRF